MNKLVKAHRNNNSYCDVCKTDAYHWDMVMLWDDIWYSIAEAEAYICPDCIEKLIGRKIKAEDLRYNGNDFNRDGFRIPTNVKYARKNNLYYPPISPAKCAALKAIHPDFNDRYC